MDMPCNCPDCGEVVELNDMVRVEGRPDYSNMVCEDCAENYEDEDD